MKTILDTNFVLECVKRKIDFGKIGGAVIPLEVINELSKIKAGEKKLKDREAADVALELIKMRDFKMMELGGKVDASIIKLAGKEKIKVATFDRELKRRLAGKAEIFEMRELK